MDATPIRRLMGWLGFAGLAFVIYGSLLPFDFATPAIGSLWRAILDLDDHGQYARSLGDSVVNLFLYFPASALLFGSWHRPGNRVRALVVWLAIVGLCGAVSFAVEITQAFIVGRTSSWIDLLRNVAGAALGPIAWLGFGARCSNYLNSLLQNVPLKAFPVMARIALLSAPLYLLVVVAINGFFSRPWRGWSGLEGSVGQGGLVRWLPFFHHYEADILWAATSSIKFALLYAPIGALWLAYRLRRPLPNSFTDIPWAVGIAAVLAGVLEVAKLFFAEMRPDTANIIIAMLGALLGWLAVWRLLVLSQAAVVRAMPKESGEAIEHSLGLRGWAMRIMAVVAAAGTVVGAMAYPFAAPALGLALAIYAVILWKWHAAWLVVLPALFPFLDLTPWSGWYFLTEIDLFVGVTLAFGLWRFADRPCELRLPRSLRWALWLLSGSYLVSMGIGIWPLQPLDQAAFSHLFSHYAALLPAKAFFSALVLIAFSVHEADRGVDVARRFTAGMLIGLIGVCLVALWERIAYPGLFDFTRDHRIAASFSSMNTGGGHVEGYLVLAIPFIAAGIYFYRSLAVRVGLAVLLLVSSYVLMVTFSRSGYGGFALSWVVLAAALLLVRRTAGRGLDYRLWAVPAALAVIAGLVVVPIVTDRYAQSRLATVDADWQTRVSHWNEALNIMRDDWNTRIFGMGLGRFPETYFFQGKGAPPSAPFRFHTESGNTFLRLGVGAPLYVDQIISIEPNTTYKLMFNARVVAEKAVVNVLLCERTFFYSAGCRSAVVRLTDGPGGWAAYAAEIHSGALGGTAWYARRPVKLSLENASASSALDVDNVRLIDPHGKDRVANGDFSRGGARWYYSSAVNHLPWHIKNLPLEVYFGQGLLGLLGMLAVVGAAAVSLATRGSVYACVVLSALAAFLAVGWFDSLVDAPKLATLFFMTLGIAVVATCAAPPQVSITPAQAPSSQHAVRAVGPQRHGDEWAPFGAPFPWKHLLVGAILLTVMGWLITSAPGVPYNVRELPNPMHPKLALAILSLFAYWAFAVPAILAVWTVRSGTGALLLPGAALLHSLIAWALIHLAVYPESIHDVVGSPILGWPWEWERMGRFAALFLAISIAFTGGAIAVVTMSGKRSMRGAVSWGVTAALLLPLSYWVVVENAATDNLVELLAERGAGLGSLGIIAWLGVLAFNGGVVARMLCQRTWRGVAGGCLVTAVALPIAWYLISTGTAPEVTLGQRTFSALQFLLSADRAHLVDGVDLILRYTLFHTLLVAAIALVQYPVWMSAYRRP